jgi:hypothetical protein
MAGFCALRAWTPITSPGFTWYDGMSTLRPLTVKWPWRASWRACARDGRQAEAVEHVVQAALQQLEQRLAGDAARPVRHLEVAAELVLEHAVDALDLLLLAQLQPVAHDLRLAQLAVLAGGRLRFSIAHFSV